MLCDALKQCPGYGVRHEHARAELFREIEPLAVWMSKRFAGGKLDESKDVDQECRLAAIDAINKWSTDGGNLIAILSISVKRRVVGHYRALNRQPLDGLDDEIEDGTSFDQIVSRVDINRALDPLSPKEKHVVQRRFGLNGCERQPCQEIARDLGIDNSRVTQLTKSSYKKMAHYLESYSQ